MLEKIWHELSEHIETRVQAVRILHPPVLLDFELATFIRPEQCTLVLVVTPIVGGGEEGDDQGELFFTFPMVEFVSVKLYLVPTYKRDHSVLVKQLFYGVHAELGGRATTFIIWHEVVGGGECGLVDGVGPEQIIEWPILWLFFSLKFIDFFDRVNLW